MDSPEAIALVLFLPLLLAPLFALVKWALLGLLRSRRPRMRVVLLVAVAESFLPLIALIAVMAAVRALNGAGVPDHVLPRAPVFLLLLAGLSFALNAVCLSRWHPGSVVRGVRTVAVWPLPPGNAQRSPLPGSRRLPALADRLVLI